MERCIGKRTDVQGFGYKLKKSVRLIYYNSMANKNAETPLGLYVKDFKSHIQVKITSIKSS